MSKQRQIDSRIDTFPAAKEQINAITEKNPQGVYHVMLFHVGNITQLMDEYGFSFAMAVLEEQAVLLQRCFQLSDDVVLCWAGSDTLMAFVQCEDAQEVEEHGRRVQEKLQACFFGRREKLQCIVTIGICHVTTQRGDFEESLACARRAIAYGLRNQVSFTVYEESMAEEDIPLEEDMPESRRPLYDSSFVAFAVSLLSGTQDLDTGLDMLIKQIGWHYDYDEVLVSEFIGGNSTM
ncbi:MAG: GGDEF domain-containing protein, partial [Acetatifactor sp.]|nr:GGDEF domain-containing protein [Acetatifactor sp.]